MFSQKFGAFCGFVLACAAAGAVRASRQIGSHEYLIMLDVAASCPGQLYAGPAPAAVDAQRRCATEQLCSFFVWNASSGHMRLCSGTDPVLSKGASTVGSCVGVNKALLEVESFVVVPNVQAICSLVAYDNFLVSDFQIGGQIEQQIGPNVCN